MGVLLVLYSVVVGLSVPVGPGIARISPEKIDLTGAAVLEIKGYNADLGTGAEVWLKHRDFYLKASEVEATGKNLVRATFDTRGKSLPDSIKDKQMTLFVQTSADGLFGLPGAVAVTQNLSGADHALSSGKPEVVSSKKLTFPFRTVLYETIRNLNYHVPMWFAMITLLFISFVFSNLYLIKGDRRYDRLAMSFAMVALTFGLLGLATGSFWARFTWLTFWTRDPKLNGAAIGVLIYVAYFILRSSMDDEDKRGRIASVFNIFAFPLFIVLIIVIPKMEGFSLHPGSGDSVGFSQYDLDSNLRRVFYPAVLGWILVGTWLGGLNARIIHLIKQAE